MATGSDVLGMLIPTGGWVITGDKYEGIQFIDSKPISKEEFEAGFEKYDAWKIEQEISAKAKRETALAKLAALGLTTDDLSALGL